MNAKRKAARVQETGDDQLTDEENAQLAAEAEGLAPRDTSDAAGDPAQLAATADRPGQAPDRDDAADTAFRASQGTGAGTASGTWKPAEPTAVMAGPDIPEIPLAEAKPGYEAVNSARVPGMGDPQNGVVLTDWRDSPIAWVNPTWPTHQPNDGPASGGGPVDDPQTRAADAGGAPGKDVGQQTFAPAEQGTEPPPPAGEYQNSIFEPDQPAQN